MKLTSLIALTTLCYAAPETTLKPETTLGDKTLETTQTADVTKDETVNSGPIITVTPVEAAANPLDALIQKCDAWEFPESSFSKQSDSNKIYTNVANTDDGPFKDAKLTKYISIAGIRVIGGDDEAEKIRHVGHTLAKILDKDQDGKIDQPNLVEELRKYRPTLYILKDAEAILQLMGEPTEEDKFPVELKFCPFAFDFEEGTKILPGGKIGDATCETDGATDNKYDRSISFVLDHLVGRGFNAIFSEKEKEQLSKIYKEAEEAGTFDADSTGCPPESDTCGLVMFVSWGLSSLNNFDKCWCEQTGALKFCDSASLHNGEPELAKLLESKFKNLTDLPKGDYAPKNKSIIGA